MKRRIWVYFLLFAGLLYSTTPARAALQVVVGQCCLTNGLTKSVNGMNGTIWASTTLNFVDPAGTWVLGPWDPLRPNCTNRFSALPPTGYMLKEWCAVSELNLGNVVPLPDKKSYTVELRESDFDGATKSIGNDVHLSYLLPHFVWLDYQIEYDDGSSSFRSPTYCYTNHVTLSTDVPTKTGHRFESWGLGDETFMPGQSVLDGEPLTGAAFGATTSGVVKLTARWAANAYTIVFDGNDATSGATEPMSMSYGVSKKLNANGFRKTGYAFKGWSKDRDASQKSYDDGQEVVNLSDRPDVDGDEVFLYAVWLAETYEVSFDGNGADAPPDGMKGLSLAFKQRENLPACAFSRTGHAFLGWSTRATGPVEYGDRESFQLPEASDLTLYAIWDAHAYHVAFDGNGATGGVLTNRSCFYAVEYALPSNAFTRTGYAFAGWATNRTSDVNGVVWRDGGVVSNLTAVADATNTLYAVWTPNAYRIAFDANATGCEGSTPSTNVFYDAECALPSNGFERTGHAFSGWATNETRDVAAFADGATVSNLTAVADAVCTLYAVWTAEFHRLKFDLNGGTGTVPAETNVPYGVQLALPGGDGFENPGCAFAGWSVTAGGAPLPDATVTIDRAFLDALGDARTLYVVWKRTDGDLRAALDLPSDDQTFSLVTDGWFVTDRRDVASSPSTGGTCLMATNDYASLDMLIRTNGTLTFSWRIRDGYQLWFGEKTSPLDIDIESFKDARPEWTTCSYVVTNAPVRLQWSYTQGWDASEFAVLDRFIWMPASRTGFYIRLR